MGGGVRWRLSVMMFLQYAIWGSWGPVLSAYLERIGFTGYQMGQIYSLLPLGCMIAPFIGGQLADRYFPTEKMLVALHLSGGVILCLAATTASYETVWLLMLAWSLVYAPTLALTNSITFHHLPDAEQKFGLVRVFGTIGWIAAGLVLSTLRQASPDQGGFPFLGGADSLWLAGFFSIALAFFSFALPRTPPAKTGTSPWAFLAGFRMMRDPSFALFIAIVFVVSTELQFYYILTAPFLQTIGISSGNVPAVMTIAQIAEIGTMLALPWMLKNWGVRRALAIGILAWPIRYAVFALGEPTWLVVAALSLHGICYVCFFVVAFIYVNSVSAPDIRASAQSFITFVSLGAGMYVGSLFAGFIRDLFTTVTEAGPLVDYTGVFLVPCALTVICAILFFIGFKERKEPLRATYQTES